MKLNKNLLLPLLAACTLLLAVASQAAAPLVKTQSPGDYRTMLGDVEITALSDGSHPFPIVLLTHLHKDHTGGIMTRPRSTSSLKRDSASSRPASKPASKH